MNQAPSVDTVQTADPNAIPGSESPAPLDPIAEIEREKAELNGAIPEGEELTHEQEIAALEQLQHEAEVARAKEVQAQTGESQPLADDGAPKAQTPAESEGEEIPTAVKPGEQLPPTDSADEATVPGAEGEVGKADKPPQYRIRPRTDVGARMMQYLKENPGMEETEALQHAQEDYGIAPNTSEPGEATATETEVHPLELLDLNEHDENIADLRSQQKELYDAYENEKAEEFNQQIDEAISARAEARESNFIAEQQQAAAADAELDQLFDASNAEAVEAYPDAADPESALAKESVKIDQELTRLGSPIADDANKPLIITNMAAAKLGIPPATAAPAAAAAPAVPVTPQTPPPTQAAPIVPGAKVQAAPQVMHPASGIARSSAATKEQTFDQKIDAASTPEDMEAIRAEAGMSTGFN